MLYVVVVEYELIVRNTRSQWYNCKHDNFIWRRVLFSLVEKATGTLRILREVGVDQEIDNHR